MTLPLLTELMGGLPNPPPEGALSERREYMVSGINRLI